MAEGTNQEKRQKEPFGEKIDKIVSDAIDEVGIDDMIDEAVGSVERSFGDKKKSTRPIRENVVMVRINKDSLEKINDLVEVGIVNSRSEAAAYFIDEGIRSKQEFFSQVSEKLEKIKKTREELRQLL